MKLLAFYCFGDKTKTDMLNIINHCEELPDGKLKYMTKSGAQVNTIEELENENVKVIDQSAVDFKASLHWWFKEQRNQPDFDKPVVVDQSITTGEIYQGNSWRYSLMIVKTETEIKVKPIFE